MCSRRFLSLLLRQCLPRILPVYSINLYTCLYLIYLVSLFYLLSLRFPVRTLVYSCIQSHMQVYIYLCRVILLLSALQDFSQPNGKVTQHLFIGSHVFFLYFINLICDMDFYVHFLHLRIKGKHNFHLIVVNQANIQKQNRI